MACISLVVTSDSVYHGLKEDRVTPLVESRAPGLGLKLEYSIIVPNSVVHIRSAVLEASRRCEIVLVAGGTGVSPRDVTVEAVRGAASRELPGFGEELRRRSYGRVGARGLLSRASLVVVEGSLVFLVPGSPDAVDAALDLIGEMYGHALHQVAGKRH